MYPFPWPVTAFVGLWMWLKDWWRHSLVSALPVLVALLAPLMLEDFYWATKQRFYGAYGKLCRRLGNDVLASACEARAEQIRRYRREAMHFG